MQRAKWNTFAEWKGMGRRWYQEIGIPPAGRTYWSEDNPLTAEQAVDWIRNSVGFTDSDLSGIVADEFGLGADAPTDTHPHRDPRYRTAPYTEVGSAHWYDARISREEGVHVVWRAGSCGIAQSGVELLRREEACDGGIPRGAQPRTEEGFEVLRGEAAHED